MASVGGAASTNCSNGGIVVNACGVDNLLLLCSDELPSGSILANKGVTHLISFEENADSPIRFPSDDLPCTYLNLAWPNGRGGVAASDDNLRAAVGETAEKAKCADNGSHVSESLVSQLTRAASLLGEVIDHYSGADIGCAGREDVARPKYDTEPGESSDEEGGGVRLRVRVTRTSDEKWGVKWHKNIFKQSQRLVVDEVAEGSVLADWNAHQSPCRQVGYGDRLLRINGVRMDELSASVISAKMRAELQRESMSALFWRPGTGEPEIKEPTAVPSQASAASSSGGPRRSTWLLSASSPVGGVAAAAAVAAVYASQQESESKPSPGELFRETYKTLAVCAELPSARVDAVTAALDTMGERTHGGATITLGSPPCSAPVPTTVVDDSTREGGNSGEVGGSTTVAPRWNYSCRKCNTVLFHDLHIMPHAAAGVTKHSRAWGWRSKNSAADAEGFGEGEGEGEAGEEADTAVDVCTSVFIEPMKWMADIASESGKLACGNPRCRQKLGGFSWHGMACNCGQWQCPAFQIHKARLDCLPARHELRGSSAPTAVPRS
eukprot:TRINITY_DN13913_c0_g1_i1.p1 TRINITY_DN13913_c0_g1~~TRINITY_DN13913_c0_g1_i1.p1  ORF type:complete len:552 (-),score=79.38 TRINITY_DN13913_c0_g1_i1:168-1823(-)